MLSIYCLHSYTLYIVQCTLCIGPTWCSNQFFPIYTCLVYIPTCVHSVHVYILDVKCTLQPPGAVISPGLKLFPGDAKASHKTLL